MKSENIVVLGAGIAGISAAYHLKQQNKQVKVFEKIMIMVVYAEDFL